MDVSFPPSKTQHRLNRCRPEGHTLPIHGPMGLTGRRMPSLHGAMGRRPREGPGGESLKGQWRRIWPAALDTARGQRRARVLRERETPPRALGMRPDGARARSIVG